MGYLSRVKGEIIFSPELTKDIINNNTIIQKYISNDFDVFLDSDWSTISGPEDKFKAYWLMDNMRELVAELLKINSDTVFKGFIEIQGEGDGVGNIDLRRMYVKGGQVVEVRPKLVWDEN